MKSLQLQLCEGIAKALQETKALVADGAVVFCEDKFNPVKKVAENSSTRLRVMVTSTGHARKPGGGKSAAGDATVEVIVFENPSRRSANPNALTVTRAAEEVVAALHWKSFDGFDHLRYQDMARADADDNDYRMIVSFAAFTALDPAKAVKWGAGDCFLGEVQTKTVTRGGVLHIETAANGRYLESGVEDPHWEIDLTAEVRSQITETDLPKLGGSFTYGGRSYITTSAILTEAGEDTTTVRLAGRTKGE